MEIRKKKKQKQDLNETTNTITDRFKKKRCVLIFGFPFYGQTPSTNLSMTSHLNPFPNSMVVGWYLCGTFVDSSAAYYHHRHRPLALRRAAYNSHWSYSGPTPHRPPFGCDASAAESLRRFYYIWLRYAASECNRLPVRGNRVTWHRSCSPSEMEKRGSINFTQSFSKCLEYWCDWIK